MDTLIERRAFSCTIGDIFTVVDEVLALDRTDEVVIIFNDTVVPVHVDDDRRQVLRRYDELRSRLAK